MKSESSPGPSELWFERLHKALHLPFWVGAFVFGVVGFLAIQGAVALGLDLVNEIAATGYVYLIPVAPFVALLAQGAARMARQKIERLNDYAGTMGARTIDLRPLYSVRNFLVFYLVMQAIIHPLYIFYGLPQTIPLEHRIAIQLPYIYWTLFIIAFVWVWIYSMYCVRKICLLPLQLKPFTEDRSLGLKPFGTFSLLLTGSFLAITALMSIANVAAGLTSLQLTAFLVVFLVLAWILFLLPLLPLRRKLQLAKQELIHKIGVRYTRAFEQIDFEGRGRIDQGVVDELAAIDKIQRDAHQIYTWPFDIGILLRLSAIVLSIAAIILARLIMSALQI